MFVSRAALHICAGASLVLFAISFARVAGYPISGDHQLGDMAFGVALASVAIWGTCMVLAKYIDAKRGL